LASISEEMTTSRKRFFSRNDDQIFSPGSYLFTQLMPRLGYHSYTSTENCIGAITGTLTYNLTVTRIFEKTTQVP
jgi:hypothetical protein